MSRTTEIRLVAGMVTLEITLGSRGLAEHFGLEVGCALVWRGLQKVRGFLASVQPDPDAGVYFLSHSDLALLSMTLELQLASLMDLTRGDSDSERDEFLDRMVAIHVRYLD